MTDMLTEMLQAQLDLQRDSFGADPTTMDRDEAIRFIHWNHTALADEQHEMLGEVGWKPWATSRHINAELALAEMVDGWHFFMNQLWAIYSFTELDGPPTAEGLAARLRDGYLEKRAVNERRQKEGYDGVEGKCPSCSRDVATTAVRRNGLGLPPDALVCPCGKVL